MLVNRMVVATVGMLAIGGAAASIPDANGVIHGCYNSSSGNLRVIDSATETCRSSELALNWDQHGTPGPQGLQGLQGPAGPAGANGAPGAQGPAGQNGATGPQGPAGPTGPTGAAGADGAAGPTGATGPAGADGPAGPQGIQGLPGPATPGGGTISMSSSLVAMTQNLTPYSVVSISIPPGRWMVFGTTNLRLGSTPTSSGGLSGAGGFCLLQNATGRGASVSLGGIQASNGNTAYQYQAVLPISTNGIVFVADPAGVTVSLVCLNQYAPGEATALGGQLIAIQVAQ